MESVRQDRRGLTVFDEEYDRAPPPYAARPSVFAHVPNGLGQADDAPHRTRGVPGGRGLRRLLGPPWDVRAGDLAHSGDASRLEL